MSFKMLKKKIQSMSQEIGKFFHNYNYAFIINVIIEMIRNP